MTRLPADYVVVRDGQIEDGQLAAEVDAFLNETLGQ